MKMIRRQATTRRPQPAARDPRRQIAIAGSKVPAERVNPARRYAGAAAVMVGTVLLRTDESAATQTHKDALADPAFTRTVLTHAFTGRPARALKNGFIDRHQATPVVGVDRDRISDPGLEAALEGFRFQDDEEPTDAVA